MERTVGLSGPNLRLTRRTRAVVRVILGSLGRQAGSRQASKQDRSLWNHFCVVLCDGASQIRAGAQVSSQLKSVFEY